MCIVPFVGVTLFALNFARVNPVLGEPAVVLLTFLLVPSLSRKHDCGLDVVGTTLQLNTNPQTLAEQE